MSNKHYDIAIIGGSLTARIAAALLAKNGSRVLFLRDHEAMAPAWFHSSIFLEKLLGILGGRSCFVAPNPFQVISKHSRLTISNDVLLDDELKREFGSNGPEVSNWLEELHHQGTQLEELFWSNGGVPWPSLKASARFKLLCMKHKVNPAQLEVTVTDKLTGMNPPGKEFIVDLLQGLSLKKIDTLSYARAAMLWAQALRPENLKEPDFSDMLNKRYEQFHGAKAQLDDLAALDYDGSKWTGGRFKSGGHFTAQYFLLGDKQCLGIFNGDKTLPSFSTYTPSARRTDDLTGQLSPLLKTRVICGGELPLRVAIEGSEQERTGLVLSSPAAEEAEIRRQLEAVLPFAKYKFSNLNVSESAEDKSEICISFNKLSAIPLRIKSNLYYADRSALLPEMGAAGAALLAWTIFENLGGKAKQGK